MLIKKKKQPKYTLELTNYEYYYLLDVLLAYRDKLIDEGRYTDFVDETLIKIMK